MKLDLKRMSESIKAKENAKNGPEDPILILKKNLAAKGYSYDEKTNTVKPLNSNIPVTDKDMNSLLMTSMRETNMNPSQFQQRAMPKINMQQGSDVVPESGEKLKQRLLDEGIMIERNGDLIPTEKYNKLKKEGKLYKYRLD